LFLRNGFPFQIAGEEVTARELYWFGRRERIFHPLLRGAILLAVDPSKRHDLGPGIDWQEPWDRPLYLILQRDEKYLCGLCTFKRNSVSLVPHPDCPVDPVTFVNGREAEVVGRVVSIARTFP
jgi:hypothetical protein